MEAQMLRKLLLPIDLTEPAFVTRALEDGQRLAKPFASEVRLVNVQSLIPIRFLDYVPADFDRGLESNVRKALEAEVAALAAQIDLPQGRVSSVVLFGPPHDRILEEAERWGADLILISSHRPGMDRFLIGSVASAIVKRAKCSVLVLRG
jgi:universal stress protein F